MPKRAAEAPPSSETHRSQVAELLSQDERPFENAIGVGMSNFEKEKMNVLLRQYVRNLTPEVDEMQQRVSMLKLIGPEELRGASDDDIQLLLSSEPDLVKKIMSQHSEVLLSKLEDIQQEVENLLDEVVTTCRPMTCGEKQDLQKSIKELPGKNLGRIAEIVGNHYISFGNDLSDGVIVNLNQLDNVKLRRLHFYVTAVKRAVKRAGPFSPI